MLRDRLLTAALLIPLVVFGVLELPTPWIGLILALLTLLGAWEWAALSGYAERRQRLAYSAAYLPLLGLLWWLPSSFALWLLGGVAVAWLGASLWLLRLRQPLPLDVGGSPLKLALGLVVLLPTWWALLLLHGREPDGPLLLLALLVLIWGADSGAYFAGRRWGRLRLAPLVSPGKTLEGALGALAVGLLAGGLLAWWQPWIGLGWALLLTLVVVVISISGDLLESWMKRRAGVKDSGQLLPGHGGILDRIDSLTAAAPSALFLLLLLERSA